MVETKRIIRTVPFIAALFLLGFFAGFMIRGFVHKESLQRGVEIREGGWAYINPLLECEQAQNLLQDNELSPIKKKVEAFINKDLHKKWGDDVSVYFRELNDGLSFSIGESEQFYPASLLKVPEMVSILKTAESTPGLLRKQIVFKRPELKAVQNADAADKLVFGRSYTVEDLIKRMIEYSDNVSADLLEDVINPSDLKKTYDVLGIPDPYYLNDQSGYMISAELYSSFFRILFNASYLNKEMSEKALSFLANTDYREGLVAGLPSQIAVAHKFGLRKVNGIKQLHDCGIIYYPGRPYFLCVMTSGPVPEYQDTTIAEISRFIFKELDRQNGIN